MNPNTKNGPDLEDIRRWAEGFETLLKDECKQNHVLYDKNIQSMEEGGSASRGVAQLMVEGGLDGGL